MEIQLRVTFQPQGRSVFVLRGTMILEAAAHAGLVVETPCGGSGTCGKCRIQVMSNAGAPTSADKQKFSDQELRDGWRLACQNPIETDIVVFVPQASLFGGTHQILATAESSITKEVLPAIRKVYVELSPPTLEDDASDLLRLERSIGPFKADLHMVRHVSKTLRAQGFKGTAVLSDHRLLDFETGNTNGRCFGVAFDIGTTTIVGQMLSLRDGKEIGVASRLNPQVSFGDDVLSRIKHAAMRPENLDELRLTIIREIASMIDALCVENGISRENIYEATFAGNTTMEHILCGINPAQLGELPFVPTHTGGLLVPAVELGIPIHHGALAYIFPIIGGFVGGDTVAGMMATGMYGIKEPTLMVDIGTNGEIVLAHKDKFYAASTAAGPAFEGARIECGMRGSTGAIEKVIFDGDVRVEVIGNVIPSGICGSGLIDLVAELLSHGIVTPEGQLLPKEELPQALAPTFTRRLQSDENGETSFVIAEATPGKIVPPVLLTQRDIREVQLGSGAIRAGIAILLRNAGIKVSDLKTVLIAGGFGNFIRRSSAQRIGLLPAGIDHHRIRYIGNASLAGAKAALLSTEVRRHGEELARQVNHVDLSTAEGFHEQFSEAMIFPSMMDVQSDNAYGPT
ncbi:MAG: hypothetical protein A2283_14390 [Lentisphaerae bacterium RIFOXYA12_FULL_48_11]|nr:MAG: hypothetical protein A2283_14390 [Lentisphaerae bacterium RIFOXYA12_FULL_48_11]